MNSSNTQRSQKVIPEIVKRVAENVEHDAMNLTPLSRVMDSELLTTFVSTDAVATDVSIQFEYEQCKVKVCGDGRVSVVETPPRPKEGVG